MTSSVDGLLLLRMRNVTVGASVHGLIFLRLNVAGIILFLPHIIVAIQKAIKLTLLLFCDRYVIPGKRLHRLERLLFVHFTLWLPVEQLAHAHAALKT